MTLTVAFLILCLAAPAFMPNDPHYVDLKNAKLPPNDQYPWGTDGMGRCVFSRVLAGASTTVFSALAIVGLTLAIGSLIGIIGGYAGGMVDSMLMRIVDVFLAFPGMVLALAVAGMLGKGLDQCHHRPGGSRMAPRQALPQLCAVFAPGKLHSCRQT